MLPSRRPAAIPALRCGSTRVPSLLQPVSCDHAPEPSWLQTSRIMDRDRTKRQERTAFIEKTRSCTQVSVKRAAMGGDRPSCVCCALAVITCNCVLCLRLAETLPATVQLYHLLLLELDRPGQAPVDLSGEQSPIRTNPIDAQLYGRRCKPVGVIAIR